MTLNDILVPTTAAPLPESSLSFENYPNPTNDYTFISFKLHAPATVNLDITDLQGKLIAAVIRNEKRDLGKYVERIDLTNLQIPSGVYFLRLQVDGQEKTKRQILVK